MKILSQIKRNFSDTAVMSGRVLRHAFRSIDTLITVVAMPIVMMLLFGYVLGGAMNTGSVNYLNYVVPGIILYAIASGTAYAALRLHNDVSAGIFDRFHSMPILKSSILGGHVLTSLVFNMFSAALVLLFAVLIGFRPEAGIAAWLLVVGIMLLFTLTMTWVSVTFGLLASSAEGAGVFAYLVLVLLFISSAFAPTESMPGIVRAFAEHQPMTPLIETMRSLLLNKSVGNNALLAVIWCVGICIAFYIAATQIYKHKTA